jgi:hypothetical protein
MLKVGLSGEILDFTEAADKTIPHSRPRENVSYKTVSNLTILRIQGGYENRLELVLGDHLSR